MTFSRWTNCSPLRQWSIMQLYKEMNHQAMKRHEGTLNIYHWVSERSQSEKNTYCMISTLTFCKSWHSVKGKTIETVKNKISGCQGLGGERGEQAEHRENFWGSEHILDDIKIMHTCHFTFVQTHRMYNIKNDPNVNHGLWVMMMCQCRLISCKNVPPGGDW